MKYEHKRYSVRLKNNKKAFHDGMIAGIPIGLGYLAVSFSLGITGKNGGLKPFKGFIASIFCPSSAGEYAGFTLIAAMSSYLEMAIVTLIANARYLLMSCAMSQRLKPGIPFYHRMLMAYTLTDELFSISIARQGYLNPYYSYGAVLITAPCWSIGTALGVTAGNLLPLRLVSAFNVALYGMFLAAIIPAAKKDKIVALLIIICFIASFSAAHLPVLSDMSDGTRTILLTVILSSGAAVLFPKNTEQEQNNHE